MGSSDFVRSILDELEDKKAKIEFPREASPTTIQSLIGAVASRLDLSNAEVTGGSRRRHVVEARNLISHIAVRGYGMNLTEVSIALQASKQSVLRGIEMGERLLQEKGWEVKDLLL